MCEPFKPNANQQKWIDAVEQRVEYKLTWDEKRIVAECADDLVICICDALLRHNQSKAKEVK